MRKTSKLSIELSVQIIDAFGGGAQVARVLNGEFTASAVSHWKRHGMPINNAALLKIKNPRHPIWKEVKI